MKKLLLIISFAICGQFGFSQSNQEIYEQAFQDINCMLNNTCSASFKDAVFTVENAYFENKLDTNKLNNEIKLLKKLAESIVTSRTLNYEFSDKKEVEKCASLFSVITDTTYVLMDSNKVFIHNPFQYDFNDVFGQADWSNMFLSKLLVTKKGNCHSLPFLYKILADEINTKAHIAVAPNHFYIKHQNKANGWYNTELTSGIFPIDAWLMASCMIDLAKGYERKLGVLAQNEFVLKCCDAALKVYPNYVNALLLKAETKKKMFDALMAKFTAQYPADILNMPEAQKLFSEMTNLYAQIHEMVYRKMHEEMYLDWLVSLKEERTKYENKEISNFKSKNR